MCDLFAVADLVSVHMVCVTVCIPSIYEVVGEHNTKCTKTESVKEENKFIYCQGGLLVAEVMQIF